MANYIVNNTDHPIWSDAAKQQVPAHSYISVSAAVYAAQASHVFTLTTVQPTGVEPAPTHVTDGTTADVGRQNRASGDLT